MCGGGRREGMRGGGADAVTWPWRIRVESAKRACEREEVAARKAHFFAVRAATFANGPWIGRATANAYFFPPAWDLHCAVSTLW